MQAYLIDPKARTVETVDYNNENWRNICDHIDAPSFDVAGTDKLSVYVDDEGLYAKERYFFRVEGYPQPLCNKALLLGPVDYATGETLEAPWTLEDARALVTFMTFGEALEYAKELQE